MNIVHTRFVLAVPDADVSATFYIEKLGFKADWREEGMWHQVSRGACTLMLASCPDAIPPPDLGDHSYFGYFEVDDVDAFHAELKARGFDAPPPEDKPWGLREFAVHAPDGFRFTIGQPG